MATYFVVDNPQDWSAELPGVETVAARTYLTDPGYGGNRGARVFNLCKSYSYQSTGYYVSLLAAARGQRPQPTVAAIQDMKSTIIIKITSQDLDDLIQSSLAHIQSDEFTLSIYFGKNPAKHYDRLCARLFEQFEAPLLRAGFVRTNGKWALHSIKPISADKVPDKHWPSVIFFASEYFTKKPRRPRKTTTRYDLAILANPEEEHPPSNDRAIKKFTKAAEALGFGVELITRADYARLAEFDALFIRETTNVAHHTYRFSQRAAAQGLVVVDDPESILKCTNKVFLAELLQHYGIDCPKTLIVHKGNRGAVAAEIGLPCILKQPDSSFSQGVFKVDGEDELKHSLDVLLDKSDLIIAQEFLPTDFDWRIGVFDRRPIYTCKYYMAKKQWKIQHTDQLGRTSYGGVDAIPRGEVPPAVIKAALKVSGHIGNGLYGVDIKQVQGRVLVIEVNDNPSIDAGFEDALVKDQLYHDIMHVFLKRIEEQKERWKS